MASDFVPLETGYGPTAPPNDNLCNDFVQGSARSFDEFTKASGNRRSRIAGVITMTDAGSPVPFFNRAILEQPVGDLGRLLEEVHNFYSSVDGPAPFLFDSAWPTPDLRPHGYTLMGHPPLMLRSAHAPLPAPHPELRIVPVEDDTTARDYEYALAYGYPAEQMQPVTKATLLTAGARTAPGWRHFVGYADDKPVASGSAYIGEHLVRIDNIATLAEVRGRGFGRAITAAAVSVDAEKPTALVASDLGRPIYEKLGFVAIMRATYWLGSHGTPAS